MRTVSNLEISVFVSPIRLKGGLAGMLVKSTRIVCKYFSLDENCCYRGYCHFRKLAVDLLHEFS